MKLTEILNEKIKYKDIAHNGTPPDFILGPEIERTQAYGKKTLIVTNIEDLKKIDKIFEETNAEHLYFGLDSAIPKSKNIPDTIAKYKRAARRYLDKGVLCTIEVPAEYAADVASLSKYDNFIAHIVVYIPGINKFNKRAALKLADEKMFGSNGGVWVTDLKKIMIKSNFTSWSRYEPSDRGVDLE